MPPPPDRPREIIVISDLHLGGAPPEPDHPRGFRICTQIDALAEFVETLPVHAGDGEIELVINGDFIDFLAERSPNGDFAPFITDAAQASATLQRIVQQNEPVFHALRKHLETRWLTILLGNHDIELAYPEVRDVLHGALGRSPRLTFMLDGEPYRLSNAVIEHGNRVDEYNAVTAEQLRRLIAGTHDDDDIPPGSHLVARVMNPLKKSFPFIDLLKPEQETVVPLLLVLDPSTVRRVGDVARLMWRARRRLRESDRRTEVPVAAGASDVHEDVEPDDWQVIDALLGATIAGDEERAEFIAGLNHGREAVPVASRTADETVALLELLIGSPARQRSLWHALQVVNRDLSFEREREDDARYRDAVETYDSDIQWVVMGHTHLAKEDRSIVPGRAYLNSGTWADLIPFPQHLARSSFEHAQPMLMEFLDDLRHGRTEPTRLEKWIAFRPTFVHLEYDGRLVTRGTVRMFEERRREPASALHG